MKARQLLLFGAALATLAATASAQAPAGGSNSGQDASASRSLLPGKGRGYVGLSLGRSRYSIACGATSFSCDNTDNSVQISVGSMLGNFWGVELAYIDMGRVGRGGGTTRAQGLNLSVLGKVPVWQSLGVFGKLGTTYGRTETSAAFGSGLATGRERGFGLSYGAGVSYDFTPQLSATLGWDSHDFRFAGGGRDPVRSTSLGLQYKY
jgi:opacity protein-like surface antigen